MAFALIENNTVIEYPYTPTNFYPYPYQDYLRENLYWVWGGIVPDNPDESTYKIVEGIPYYDSNDRRWVQSWEVVELTEEDLRSALYNPAQFLQDMFASTTFEIWMSNFSTFKQAGLLDACTNGKVDDNWSVVQAIYNQYKELFTPTEIDIQEWQNIADSSGIPLTF